jgi:hypothetical protein
MIIDGSGGCPILDTVVLYTWGYTVKQRAHLDSGFMGLDINTGLTE